MKKNLIVILAIIGSIWSVPAATLTDTQSYPPPAKKGVIYIVCRFKPYHTGDTYPRTKVSVKWGSYSHSDAYGVGPFELKLKTGFVVALRHTTNDSVRMQVESEGQIEMIQQLDSPPSQWNDSHYNRYNW